MSADFEAQSRPLRTQIARSRRRIEGRLQRAATPWRTLRVLGDRPGRAPVPWALAALAVGYALARWARGGQAGERTWWRTLAGWQRVWRLIARRASRARGGSPEGSHD